MSVSGGCSCVGENSCTAEPEHSRLIFGMMLGNRWEGGAQRWSPTGNTRTQLLAPGGGAKHHIHCEFWPTSRPFQEFFASRHTLTLGPPISAFISRPALSPPPLLFFFLLNDHHTIFHSRCLFFRTTFFLHADVFRSTCTRPWESLQ